MALGIAREQAAGGGERAVMADAGEDVEHFALRRLRVADAIGGEQRQMQFARDFDRRLVARFFVAVEMALQFDVDIFAAEEFAELPHAFDAALRFLRAPARAPADLRRLR